MQRVTRTVTLGAIPLLVAASSCATARGAPRPDDMSAKEHREAARQHEAAADAHQAQYYEEIHELNVPQAGLTTQRYDPAETHLRNVTKHRMRAARHEAAAQELEARAEAESKGGPGDAVSAHAPEAD